METKKRTVNEFEFGEKVRFANEACENGEFERAVALYTDALKDDLNNFLIYSNRSAAYLKLGKFENALNDAETVQKLCPNWPKSYYRQGVALQCLGRFCESFESFGAGLVRDSTSKQLLNALHEAALKSPLKLDLRSCGSPIETVCAIAQHLFEQKYVRESIRLFELADEIDRNENSKSLLTTAVLCSMALLSLMASIYLSSDRYDDAISIYEQQLELTMLAELKHHRLAVLLAKADAYEKSKEFSVALRLHEQIMELCENDDEKAKQCLRIGQLFQTLNELTSAIDYFKRHLLLPSNRFDRLCTNLSLGHCYYEQRNFKESIGYYENASSLILNGGGGGGATYANKNDRFALVKIYAGLGDNYRQLKQFAKAKSMYEKQLEESLKLKNRQYEGCALSNLGIVYEQEKNYESALKLHEAHLAIARTENDQKSIGRALGNIANVYMATGRLVEALQLHTDELRLSKQTGDRRAEAATHGNIAIVYQRMRVRDKALEHYRAHLSLARQLRDPSAQQLALLNLANFLSAQNEFGEAVEFYNEYLHVAEKSGDLSAQIRVMNYLAFAFYSLKNFEQAVSYYVRNLELMKECAGGAVGAGETAFWDRELLAQTYCNLSVSYFELKQWQRAHACQKQFLALAATMQSTGGGGRENDSNNDGNDDDDDGGDIGNDDIATLSRNNNRAYV